MKKISLSAALILPLFTWTAAAATPTPQEMCHRYYSHLQNFVQAQFYEPPAGYCHVAVQTDGQRITGANINEGTLETCSSVVKTFDTLLYQNIPTPPSNLCRKDILFEFKISEDTARKSAQRIAVADNLKIKLHSQLKSLTEYK